MRKFFLLFGIVLSLFFVLSQQKDRTQEHVLPQQQALRQSSGQAILNITLRFPDADYDVVVPQGSTVYDLMDKANKQYGLSFSGKSFPAIGFFIEEIKGVRQDPKKGLYWIYSINGQVAQVGVSNYILKPHDVIAWTYEHEE